MVKLYKSMLLMAILFTFLIACGKHKKKEFDAEKQIANFAREMIFAQIEIAEVDTFKFAEWDSAIVCVAEIVYKDKDRKDKDRSYRTTCLKCIMPLGEKTALSEVGFFELKSYLYNMFMNDKPYLKIEADGYQLQFYELPKPINFLPKFWLLDVPSSVYYKSFRVYRAVKP